jgi:hypothetical protein
MVTGSKNLVSEVTEIATRVLGDSGLRKRRQVFTRHLSEDVLGWVGLNSAVHRGDGKLEINPVIGVRHQPLEALVAQLIGMKYHPYVPPTVSTPIGYLMPGKKYTAWLFESGVNHVSEVEKMAEAINRYGFPFMQANTTLQALIDTMLHSGFGYPHQLAYRIPTAYLLVGEKTLAEQYVDDQLKELSDRKDLAAQQYRKFVAAFKENLSERKKQ